MSSDKYPGEMELMRKNLSQQSGVALAVLAALLFSWKAIFVKLAYAWSVDAITLLMLRMAFSLPVFLVVSVRVDHRQLPLTWRDWGMLIVLGLLGYYGASVLDFLGLQYISAALERLILFTYPILTMVISVLFFGKRWERAELIALILSCTGIALAFGHDLQLSSDYRAVLIGSAFVLASSVCFALYLVLSGPMIERLGSVRFTALAMLVSTAASLLHFISVEPLKALVQPWQVYAWALFMAVFSTVVPVFMLSAAIRRLGASKVALIATIGPVVTILLGWWVLGEGISFSQLAGAALVVLGVVILNIRVYT